MCYLVASIRPNTEQKDAFSVVKFVYKTSVQYDKPLPSPNENSSGYLDANCTASSYLFKSVKDNGQE